MYSKKGDRFIHSPQYSRHLSAPYRQSFRYDGAHQQADRVHDADTALVDLVIHFIVTIVIDTLVIIIIISIVVTTTTTTTTTTFESGSAAGGLVFPCGHDGLGGIQWNARAIEEGLRDGKSLPRRRHNRFRDEVARGGLGLRYWRRSDKNSSCSIRQDSGCEKQGAHFTDIEYPSSERSGNMFLLQPL